MRTNIVNLCLSGVNVYTVSRTTHVKLHVYITTFERGGASMRRPKSKHRARLSDKSCKAHFFFFYEKISNLFIFNHGSIMNTRNNENHIQIHRPPSDDYQH